MFPFYEFDMEQRSKSMNTSFGPRLSSKSLLKQKSIEMWKLLGRQHRACHCDVEFAETTTHLTTGTALSGTIFYGSFYQISRFKCPILFNSKSFFTNAPFGKFQFYTPWNFLWLVRLCVGEDDQALPLRPGGRPRLGHRQQQRRLRLRKRQAPRVQEGKVHSMLNHKAKILKWKQD